MPAIRLVAVLKNCLLTTLLMIGAHSAHSATTAADPLTARGINPAILDLMVSNLSQDTAYTLQADIQISGASETWNDSALIIFDPATDYGVDLYMKFESKQDIETGSTGYFRKLLEKRMRLHHRLRGMDITYDPKSIDVESQDGDSAVITFRYQKSALPQAVAWMRMLQGRVYVEGDRVKRMELTSDKGRSFWDEGNKITRVEISADFARVTDGRDLILTSSSKYIGNFYGLKVFNWGEEFTVDINTEAILYTAVDGTILLGKPENIATLADIEDDLDTVRVKLDRTFPIWGKEVRKMGFDLPRPFGVSAMYSEMTTQMDFTSFEINGEQESIEAIFGPNGSGIDVDATVPQVRADWFVLPFLNVMLLAGTAEATGSVLIDTTELGELIGLPDVIREDIDLDLTMVGVGTTLGFGYKKFVVALTGTYMKTLTEGADAEAIAISFTPLVGYQLLDYRLTLLAGAEYLEFDNKMEGSIALPDGETLDFNIGIESEAWAYRVGFHKEIGSHWEAVGSYTWGDDRDGFTLLFGYRW